MARLLFEKQAVRRRNGQLANRVALQVYTDEAGTVLADISATSGGSAIPGSTVTTADIAGLGPASLRFYGPTDGTDTLYLRVPSDASLGVQKIEADPDPRLDALEAGGGGAHPNLAVHDTLGLATQTELDTILAAALPPSTIPGLELWLKADAIGGLADGAAVASWVDSSGNGRDAVQATGANQPTYQTAELNGLPVVRFDGTNDRLDCDGLAAALSGTDVAMSVFVVGKNTADGGVWFGCGSSTVAADGRSILHHRMVSGDYVFQKVDDTNSGVALAGGTPDSGFHVSSVVVPGTTGGYRLDGAAMVADGTAFNVGATTLDIAAIGALHYSSASVYAEFMAGDLAELVVYNRALSTAERQQVEWYLGRKWGLTVTTTGFSPGGQVMPGALVADADQRVAPTLWWDARSYGTDIPAVQKAINLASAAGGGIVRIRGTFSGNAATLTLKDAVHLRGDGIYASILLFSELGSGVNAIQPQTTPAPNVENAPSIADLTVQGPGTSFVYGTAPASMDGIKADARWVLTNVRTQWFRSGIKITGDHQRFLWCRSTNNYYGVYFDDMSATNRSDQHFINCGFDGNMFSTFAFHAKGILDGGSIIGGHGGWSPYVFYREAGTPDGSFLVSTILHRFSFEHVGNSAILDETTGGVADSIHSCELQAYGFSWDAARKIAARADDYAVDARGVNATTFDAAGVASFTTGDVSGYRVTSGKQNTLRQTATPALADATTRAAFTWEPPGRVGVPQFLRSGAYYGAAGSNVTSALTLDRLYAVPFVVDRPTAFDRIGVEVTVVGSAGAVVRLGVYADDAAGGYPGPLLFDAGTVVADVGTGWKEITISQTFGPGLFWLAAVMQTATCTVRLCDGLSASFLIGSQDGGNTAVAPVGYQHVGASGALPATFQTSMSVIGAAPKVRVRVA